MCSSNLFGSLETTSLNSQLKNSSLSEDCNSSRFLTASCNSPSHRSISCPLHACCLNCSNCSNPSPHALSHTPFSVFPELYAAQYPPSSALATSSVNDSQRTHAKFTTRWLSSLQRGNAQSLSCLHS